MPYIRHVRSNNNRKRFIRKNFRNSTKCCNTVVPESPLFMGFSPVIVRPPLVALNRTSDVLMAKAKQQPRPRTFNETACKLLQMPIELVEKCISDLDIESLTNFALSGVNCMALAEQIFEKRTDKSLVFNIPSTQKIFSQVLMIFGRMATGVEIDLHMYGDMTSLAAILVMHRYCPNNLSRIMLKNFELNLFGRDDIVTSLVANVEEINLCYGAYKNCGKLFSNGKISMCFIENAFLDGPTQEELKFLKNLRGLMITPNIYLDVQQFLFTNNPHLEFLIILSKFPLLYEHICELRSLSLLACSVTSGLVSKLANIPSLQRLQLEGCGEETPNVLPLFDRLVTHTALQELHCFRFNITKRMIEKLSMFHTLHVLKLDQAVSTENLEDILEYISQMATGNLRQFHVKFKHPINIPTTLFQFIIRPSLFTSDVYHKENYEQCFELLIKMQRKSNEKRAIIVSPRAIIWFQHKKIIDDNTTNQEQGR